MDKKCDPIVFVLAGGSGTRLAPLSLNMEGKLPKQFLNVLSDKTMIQETIDLFPKELEKAVISLDKFSDVICQQCGEEIKILGEPFGCNTAMAIGLGAVYALKKTGDENTVVFFKPSDHFIDKDYFTEYFYTVCDQAKKNKIVLMGIEPTRPETGLGYIKVKELEEKDGNTEVYNIECFVEKPNLEKATEYVESGRFYWNSGMFAFTVGLILNRLKTNAPEIYQSLMRIKDALGTEREKDVILEEYNYIKENNKNISIDYAVMEKESDNILMVKVEEKLKWDDIGLWIALERYFDPDEGGNRVKGENVVLEDCRDCLVLNYNQDQTVFAKNLKDLLVVNTSNGAFICPKSESIRAKDIVEDMIRGAREILIESSNISIKNTTDIPVACIKCENLKIELDEKRLEISND